MTNSGITAQYGFEFQKLAFIYYALKLAPENNIIYEGQDDVEISKPEQSVRFYQSNSFIQVKSGTVTNSILKKIFMNWLFSKGQPEQFICILENTMTIDYKVQSFADEIIQDIKNTKVNSKASIVWKLNKKYENDAEALKNDLNILIQKAQFISYSLEELNEECFNQFASEYGADTSFLSVNYERFGELYSSINYRISRTILKKESYILPFKELQKIISDVREKINDACYDISFDKFKARSKEKVEKILTMNTESVKQLKLVFPDNSEAIVNGLVEQIFYEDLRLYYSNIEKDEEIYDMEYNAHSNYEDVLQEFNATGELETPYKLYKKTTMQTINSPLFPQLNSSGFKFYNRGCYIHLTDSEIDNDLKIKWGKTDEDEI